MDQIWNSTINIRTTDKAERVIDTYNVVTEAITSIRNLNNEALQVNPEAHSVSITFLKYYNSNTDWNSRTLNDNIRATHTPGGRIFLLVKR